MDVATARDAVLTVRTERTQISAWAPPISVNISSTAASSRGTGGESNIKILFSYLTCYVEGCQTSETLATIISGTGAI